MGLFDKFLVREIKSRDGEVVFRRWRVLRTPWFQVFVHAIYEADRDYFLHDHPWNFWSLVLKGGYRDDYHDENKRSSISSSLIQKFRTHKPGSITKMKSSGEYHRISKLLKGTCWTLVVAGKSHRVWGYLTPKGWVSNGVYRKVKNEGQVSAFWEGREVLF